MNMYSTLTSLAIGLACLRQAEELPPQPNILFIRTDDSAKFLGMVANVDGNIRRMLVMLDDWMMMTTRLLCS